MRKVVIKACNILTWFILIVVLGVALSLLVPKLLGYDVLTVLSGSMEPAYHVGSVVYVDKGVSVDEIEAGDPISFVLDGTDTIATHRVVEVDQEQRQFITKGDANEANDINPISFEAFIGRVKGTLPYVGYIILNIKTKKGMIVAGVSLVVLVLLFLIPEILKPEENKKKEGEEKEHEKEHKKE